MKWLRLILVVLGTAGSTFYLLTTTNLSVAFDTASKFPASVLAEASLLLSAGLLLSGMRFRILLRDFELIIEPALARYVNLVGVWGGLLFFSIVGQTLARTAVLRRYGIGGAAVLLANVYERATALLSLATLAVAGGLVLFGKISIDMFGGGVALLKLSVYLVAVFCAALAGLNRKLLRRTVRIAISRIRLKAFADVCLISILVHGTTLFAFVHLGHELEPQIPIVHLAAASIIVMFAASLPISFAGWGVRELSAVYALGIIGFKPTDAIAVSVAIGILSLMALLVLTLFSYVAVAEPSGHDSANDNSKHDAAKRTLGITRALSWGVPLCAAAALPFQVFVPTTTTILNVNLADPWAIAGGFVFLLQYANLKVRASAWRMSGIETFAILAMLMILFGFFNGAAHFGVTNWALYNRTLGFVILLSYFATGALVVATAGELGLRMMLRTLVLSCSAIATIDILLLALGKFSTIFPNLSFNEEQVAGMSQNPNAYALQMALALSAMMAMSGRLGAGGIWLRLRIPILTLLTLAILATHSRIGYACAILIFASVSSQGIIKPQILFKTLVASFMFWIAIGLAGSLPAIHDAMTTTKNYTIEWTKTKREPIASAGKAIQGPAATPAATVIAELAFKSNTASSDAERWLTIERGLKMWMSAPIFGMGLGAFMHQMQVETGKLLVVHNSTVWLLAELGLTGFLVFATAFAMIFKTAWSQRKPPSIWATTLLLTLAIFGLSQLVHDVFYQRMFWLLLGATICSGPFPRTRAVRRHELPSSPKSYGTQEMLAV